MLLLRPIDEQPRLEHRMLAKMVATDIVQMLAL